MRNRFLISEEEKNKIRSLYETKNNYSWLIKEQYSGQKAQGYNGDVAACKKDTPFNVVGKAGLNWKQVRAAWGSVGSATENINLRNAFCEGWRPGDTKQGGAGQVASGNQQNTSSAPGQVESGGLIKNIQDGVSKSDVGDQCITVTTTGSFNINVTADGTHMTKFLDEFMQQINSNPLLKKSYEEGKLYVGGIKLLGGASNVIDGNKVKPDVDNNYKPMNSSGTFTGNYQKNKKLAEDRANGLYQQLVKQLPQRNINFGQGVTPSVTSVVVDTGGASDSKRNTSTHPNPGQIVKCEIDLCGVQAGGQEETNTGTTETNTGTTETNTGTTETNTGTTTSSTVTQEVFQCFKDARIEVNYEGKGHTCNFAVYEIYVNGIKINRDDGKDYASLNNAGDEWDNEGKNKRGGHRFNNFVIDQITAQQFVNANNLYKYKGNLQIDAKCVLKNPKNAKGWKDNDGTPSGGCHKGVGKVKAVVNGADFNKKEAKTPDKYDTFLNLANFPACKKEYEDFLLKQQQQQQTTQTGQSGQKGGLLGKLFGKK